MQTKHTLLYILRNVTISLLLLCCTVNVCVAQQKKVETVEQEDSIPLFRGVAVSADLVGIAQLYLGSYGQYEAALRINLKDKYFPIVELGYGKADAEDVATTLKYKTSAPYGRVGLDFNVLKNKHDDYRVYAGFRYAYTSFKFDVSGDDLVDPVWKDNVKYEATGVKANYHWAEVVFGVDAKILGPVRLGWSVRYKRRLFHDDGAVGNTWYVPGYGKQGGTRLGGTFNVIFEL